MKKTSWYRGVIILLCLLLSFGIAIVIKIQVLKIGDAGLFFIVENGDILTLSYTHSMYKVPVIERLKVENGVLELFHVETSDAALEYFGIKGKDVNNVENHIKEFIIPAVSVGHHKLSVRGHDILLSDVKANDQKIHISIIKQSFASYFINSIWRQ